MAVERFHLATGGFKPSGLVDRFLKAVFGVWGDGTVQIPGTAVYTASYPKEGEITLDAEVLTFSYPKEGEIVVA